MFKIWANDDLLYSDEYQDDQLYIISPSGALEIGKSGTIDFTILPSHYLYNSLEKTSYKHLGIYVRHVGIQRPYFELGY